MRLRGALTDDDYIKIEYVQPKYEEIRELVVNAAEIVTENELRSAGINFKTEISIEDDDKVQFGLTVPVPGCEATQTTNNDDQLYVQINFKCTQCAGTFTTNGALNRHMRVHDGTRKLYNCDYCSRSFPRRNLMRHMKTVHVEKESKSYECYVCGAKYERIGSLKNHLILHFDGNTLECDICSAKFSYQNALTKHNDTQAKIDIRKYRCTDCAFATASSDHFKKHCRKHTGEIPQPLTISCKFCQKTFSSNANYRKHLQTHIKTYNCHSCSKAFGNQSDLKKHSTVHALIIDPTCDICYRQVKQGHLKRHMTSHVTEKNFKCDLCPRAFSLQLNLNKHQLRHTIGNKYQCYMCPFDNRRLANLKLHFAKHTGKKILKCKVCSRRFLQKDRWKSHMNQHISGTFTCDLCPKTFSYAWTRDRHTAWHAKRSFECDICNRRLCDQAGLQRHIRYVHNGKKSHKCEICSKMFANKLYLKRHVEFVHLKDAVAENKYRCTVCTYVTNSNDKLKSHSRSHSSERPHACAECPKAFKTRSGLSVHIKGCHSKLPKVYTCKICSQTFSDRSSRLKHKMVHIDKPVFKCSICSLQLKSKFWLKFHMNVHTQPYRCEICLRKFSTKTNLNRHQSTHGLLANGTAATQIKYKCYICNHSARRIDSLKIHFSKHTGAKLFKCNFCTSAFSRPDYLRVHVRLHTGEKPFLCTKCPKKFAQGAALRCHLKVHEKIERAVKSNPSSGRKHECFRCEFSTASADHLIKHSRSHGIELNAFVKLKSLSNEQ